MKKITALAAMMLFAATVMAHAHIPPVGSPKYIGAEKCKMCHNSKGQWAPWEKSKHASAFESLKTEAADKLAAEKGFKTKAAETPECVACHQTGKSVKDAVYDEKFNASEGVGCESCHGAGSEYKTKHGKEKSKDAVALGFLMPKVADGSAEKQCLTCHNDKSPTFKGFKFEDAWKLIAHPLAAK